MDEPFHQEVQDAVDAAGAAASISDRQAVALAASFYKNARTGQTFGQYGAGWEVLAQVSAPGGYDGLAMRHAASRTLVIVNRGTTRADELATVKLEQGTSEFLTAWARSADVAPHGQEEPQRPEDHGVAQQDEPAGPPVEVLEERVAR